jgi:hypothetical protein
MAEQTKTVWIGELLEDLEVTDAEGLGVTGGRVPELRRHHHRLHQHRDR